MFDSLFIVMVENAVDDVVESKPSNVELKLPMVETKYC